MGFPTLLEYYNAVGELLQEGFEVKGLSMGSIMDLLNQSEDEFVFGTETEGVSSEKDFSYISSSLARVCVKGEKSM
jgi:hypothetical protein